MKSSHEQRFQQTNKRASAAGKTSFFLLCLVCVSSYLWKSRILNGGDEGGEEPSHRQDKQRKQRQLKRSRRDTDEVDGPR